VNLIAFEPQEEGRYDRQAQIGWWDQRRLSQTQAIVAGAGALGNEVLKLLALLGFGQVTVIDFDRVARSNLARMVLFREGDIGRPKAEVAAERVQELNPELQARAIVGDLRFDLGLGDYRAASVVFGCLDSVEARWALNRKCRQASVEWINAGISDYHGQVTRYHPQEGACYECNFTDQTWERISRRYSCPFGLRAMDSELQVPTTAVTTSAIASLQVQEALLLLHRETGGLAPGERLSLYMKPYRMFQDVLPLNPDCLAHTPILEPCSPLPGSTHSLTAGEVIRYAQGLAPGARAMELPFDLVQAFSCPSCGKVEPVLRPKEKVFQHQAICPACGSLREPEMIRTIFPDSPLAGHRLCDLGLPEHEIIEFRNPEKDESLYLQLTG
jgi:adenylyltransferase/sulfurtransferase